MSQTKTAICPDLLTQFKQRYAADPTARAAAGAVAKVGLEDASLDNDVYRRHPFVFSEELESGDITNQKASGRCWMFAALNTARRDTMSKLNLSTFEFSQNYTLFWDKLEKANSFLENILSTLDEPTDSRLIAYLLMAPVQDGGQWDMFSGILEKYGAVPKEVMPETFHSSNTRQLDWLLTAKLREYACRLREGHQNGQSSADLAGQKGDMLYYIYKVLCQALGTPPEIFDYAWRDKDEAFHRVTAITPQAFFQEYVGWQLQDCVSLINAPTADKPYGHSYTVKYLYSVYEGRKIRYINVPSEVLKKAAISQIKDGHPVWFGCDVGKMLVRDAGIMDEHSFAYEQTLGEAPRMTKAQRLDYGESLLTHAMVLQGVDLKDDGSIGNWKVENSWGEKSGHKGFYSMSDAWFDEYTYQIMVDRRYIPEAYLAALEEPPRELEPWDPMGALALVR
ncbi:C1 family peptidase [Oscillospiraceae bacterium HV4-5-C5C]|nr:C1 family peptidase [Oscillospiraceae bacterium HV4-5-C5C]